MKQFSPKQPKHAPPPSSGFPSDAGSNVSNNGWGQNFHNSNFNTPANDNSNSWGSNNSNDLNFFSNNYDNNTKSPVQQQFFAPPVASSSSSPFSSRPLGPLGRPGGPGGPCRCRTDPAGGGQRSCLLDTVGG